MEQFTLKELVKRKLDETYIIIYAIKNEVNIKKADIIEKTDLYTFVGFSLFISFINPLSPFLFSIISIISII